MNFKLNKKVKNIGLFTVGALLAAGIGVYSGSQIFSDNANAETLEGLSGDYYTHPIGNLGDFSDFYGPFTLNGQWVWCMEPTRYTNGQVKYSDGGDVYRNGYSARTFNSAGNMVSVKYSTKEMNTAAAIMPYIFLDMPLNEVSEFFNGFPQSNNLIGIITELRKQPEYVQYTIVQLWFWQFAGDGMQSPTKNVWLSWSTTNQAKHNAVGEVLGLNGSFASYAGTNGNEGWIMHWMHLMMNYTIINMDKGDWEYIGGSRIWTSNDDLQRMANGRAGQIRKAEGYLKATKEFSNLKQDLNVKPDWNPDGIRVAVYRNPDATDHVGVITIGADGQSNTMKVKPDTYYGFELTPENVPIMSSAMEVVTGTDANRGYVSGSDKKDTSKPYIVWDVKSENTESNPDVETFVNTPEVVNFTFSKEIAADSIKSLEAIDPQYTRVGAVYTLYKDVVATEPVTRNGQNVTATIGADGTAEFSNLYRGVYYVKETAVPTFVKNGRTVKRFALDKKVYKVDLSTMNDNETNTSDSTVTATKEFKQVGSFVSSEPMPPNKGSLVIKKKDADTKSNTAQGQATLQGAEFKVEFYEMTTLGTGAPVKKWETVYKTDAKGEIDVRNRNLMVSTTNADAMNKLFTAYEQAKEWGAYDYRVTEIKAPNGYKLDATPKNFIVKDGYADFVWKYDDASFLNDDLELELYKRQRVSGDWQTDTKVSVPNASFKLTNKTTGWTQTVKTDANGKLIYDGVVAGDYTLQETGVEDYQTNGQIIELKVEQKDGTTKMTVQSTSKVTDRNGGYEITTQADGDVNVVVDNTAHESKAKLVKANEKGAKLEGAKFKLTDWGEDGTQAGKTLEITTNSKGEIDWSELVVGYWYSVEETQAPKGYKLPADRMVLNFRVESVPVKNKFEVSYWTSTVNKRSESNTARELSQVKKLTKAGTMQDGIKFVTVDSDKNGKQDRVDLEFDFVNNTWQKLPATGSFAGPVIGVAVVTILIGSTVFYFRKREA